VTRQVVAEDMIHRLDLHAVKRYPSIFQVAGTNGKGSTAAFLEAGILHRGLNVLTLSSPHCTSVRERIRVNGHLIEKHLFSSLLERTTPAAEALSVAALAECQNVSLLALPRMLSDDGYRRWVLKQVTDPAVAHFWCEEYERWDTRFRSEAISPVINKVQRVLLAAPMRVVLGQVRSGIDARYIMDHRRVLIANLSKGRLGADNANFLGSLLVTQFQLASMARSDIAEDDRVDFTLVADEFQNFATDDFAGMLSESRKYRLSLVLATQFGTQVREEIRNAVLGNAGSIVSFRVGESDAGVLVREFGNDFTLEHFTDLPNHEVMAKLLDGGVHRVPFMGKTHGPAGRRHGRGYNVLRRSRERHARPRAVVEDKLRRWHSRRW
jgi:hypothetical protein